MGLLSNGLTLPRGVTSMGQLIRSELGAILPPNGNVVAYVDNSSGSLEYLPDELRTLRVQTLNAALGRCVAGQGDIVLVGSGHAESISSADQMSSLVAGTYIIGLGEGRNRPTFTWTAATATFLLDQANVTLANCVLIVASTANGGVSVAAPITVTGQGCRIVNNYIDAAGDANDLATIPVTINGAADVEFIGNRCFGATAAECTTFLRLTDADRVQVIGNYISAATSAVAVGVIQALTTASLQILIKDNYLANNKASSEEALTLMAGCTGLLSNNKLAVLDNASVALDNDGDCTYDGTNTLANEVGERGLVLGTVSA